MDKNNQDSQNLVENMSTLTITDNSVKFAPIFLQETNFNADKNAEFLKIAIEEFITDEKTIISILCNRNNKQRQDIAKSYKKIYQRDLITDLIKSDLTSKFKDAIVAIMSPIIDYHIEQLHNSLVEVHKNEDVLIIILCTLKNQDVYKIWENYKSKYGKSLESDICDNTSGDFQRLLISLCTISRDESTHTDLDAGKCDAARLYDALVGDLGTDESGFNWIFAQRNFHQLKLIFKEYFEQYNHDISTAIEREFSGNIKKALLTIECVNDTCGYFVEQLANTNNKKLIFICVSRSEIDIGEIKKAYYQKYRKTLEERITEITFGDYQECLVQLIS